MILKAISINQSFYLSIYIYIYAYPKQPIVEITVCIRYFFRLQILRK